MINPLFRNYWGSRKTYNTYYLCSFCHKSIWIEEVFGPYLNENIYIEVLNVKCPNFGQTRHNEKIKW